VRAEPAGRKIMKDKRTPRVEQLTIYKCSCGDIIANVTDEGSEDEVDEQLDFLNVGDLIEWLETVEFCSTLDEEVESN
jgi:hypothetical protein